MIIGDYQLPYCTITGTFVAVNADSSDEDPFPDVQPLNGTITLTPTTNAGRVDDAFAQILPVTVRVFGGQIVDDEDLPGVRILATDANIGVADWAWRASFKFDGLSLDPLTFKAPRDTTVNLTSGLVPIKSQPYQIVEGASIVDAEEDGAGKIRFVLSDGGFTSWIDIPNGEKGDKGDPGVKGDRGADGETPSISMGAVSAGPVAEAWLTGPALNRQLNLTLPRGERGLPGPPGPPGDGGANLVGLNGITALTQEEYDAITPDPFTLYVVTGGTPPVNPEEPVEPGEAGTMTAPAFGTAVYAGNNSATTSITLDRPADLASGDLLVVALRSQDGASANGWEPPAGFIPVTTLPSSLPDPNSRVGGIWVKPVESIGAEPASYTFTGPSGRNAGVAVRMNVGTTDVHKAMSGESAAVYGNSGASSNGMSTVGAYSLSTVPAVGLAAMGAECTVGVSRVPSTIPAGYTTLGNAQSSLDGSTSGSRTAIWLGWRGEVDLSVEETVGGFQGASASGLYCGAVGEGAG